MTDERHDHVLDSFALLALLQREERASQVVGILGRAMRGQGNVFMCLVNLGEVLYIVERKRGVIAAHATLAAIDQLPILMVTPDRDLTLAAAHIKASHTLSYADAFVVALAQRENATILTGDPEFAPLQEIVAIAWL
jgi:ribonuclease VapC